MADIFTGDVPVCGMCGHPLVGNNHGFDQNDGHLEETGKFVHSGRCTYCRLCNPRIFEKADIVRVYRIIEYVGPRIAVEKQIANSVQGKKEYGNGVTIRAASVGEWDIENIGIMLDQAEAANG